VIPVKHSGKLLVTVMGIILSSSVAVGTPVVVDGVISALEEYDEFVTDTNDIGSEDFVDSASDIDTLHWAAVKGPGFIGGDLTDVWATFGMTVRGPLGSPKINTTGDGTYTSVRTTTVNLNLMDSGGTEQYAFEARMRNGVVSDFTMWDGAGNEIPLNIPGGDLNLKYAVDTGLEIAIKVNMLPNLSPASPFDFDLLFEGGGRNDDDDMQGTIPEPATMSILLIGGLVALVRRRRK